MSGLAGGWSLQNPARPCTGTHRALFPLSWPYLAFRAGKAQQLAPGLGARQASAAALLKSVLPPIHQASYLWRFRSEALGRGPSLPNRSRAGERNLAQVPKHIVFFPATNPGDSLPLECLFTSFAAHTTSRFPLICGGYL